jgi:hypothetical protein
MGSERVDEVLLPRENATVTVLKRELRGRTGPGQDPSPELSLFASGNEEEIGHGDSLFLLALTHGDLVEQIRRLFVAFCLKWGAEIMRAIFLLLARECWSKDKSGSWCCFATAASFPWHQV